MGNMVNILSPISGHPILANNVSHAPLGGPEWRTRGQVQRKEGREGQAEGKYPTGTGVLLHTVVEMRHWSIQGLVMNFTWGFFCTHSKCNISKGHEVCTFLRRKFCVRYFHPQGDPC